MAFILVYNKSIIKMKLYVLKGFWISIVRTKDTSRFFHILIKNKTTSPQVIKM